MAIDRDKVLQTAQKLVEKKKYDKAVVEYQRVIQEDPNDARTLLKIGDLQLKMEAFGEAIATYERVGRFYASQGFALKAIAVYKQIREIIHKHVPQLEERYAHIAPKLAELYQQLGLTSDALAALDEVATRLQRQGRDPEAIEVFRRIVELDPTNPLPHLRLAEALSRARDPESAAAEFAVAAGQLLKHGRRDDALKVIERLLHHRQDVAQARIAAEIYLQRGQPNDGMLALAKLQLCFQANPKDLDTLALLARAFVAIGQGSKGIEVQKEMARIARDQGKTDLFRQLVEKLERAAPYDDQVQQLVQQTRAPAAAMPSPAAAAPAGRRNDSQIEELDDVELIETGDIEAYELDELDAVAEESLRPAPMSHARAASPHEAPRVAPPAPQPSYEDQETEAAYAEHARRVLARATSLREREDDAAAVQVLRDGLETDPRSLDIRYALRDVLIDLGEQTQAVEEMLYIASIQLDSLDGESAARTLQDVLSIDPANLNAIHTLRELGFDVPDPESYGEQQAPLPAYDLADGGEGELAPTGGEPSSGVFAEESPLPSFPLEPAESEPFDLVQGTASEVVETYDGPGAVPADAHHRSERPEAGPNPELEDALEEADFYASRGLFDDARAVLNEQLTRAPNHPLLRERMAELDAQESAGQQPAGSGARARPTEEDRSFAIAASLDALEAIDARTSPGHAPQIAPQGQVDVEEVFQKFKEGVSKQIGVDDSQSHYDLGVAYKEMGLYEDAVREFAVAARDRNRTCVCETMIGLLHMDHGEIDKAIDAFKRGLEAPVRPPAHETAVMFELAAAQEARGHIPEALAHYERVAQREPNFRDVQDRIKRLSKVESSPKLAQAVGDDEFDRAFADIIGPDK